MVRCLLHPAPPTMSNRFAFAAIAASFALSACGSTGSSATQSQAPVYPGDASSETMELAPGELSAGQSVDDLAGSTAVAAEPWAPVPWTGAFMDSAVMLADSFRIEGPQGLLEHVVASSDDELFERSLQTTPDGLLQVISRTSENGPEIRVQVDGWTLAAFRRVTILERVGDSAVRVIASGDALWRDANGRIAKGSRIECQGEIGDQNHAIPAGATAPTGPSAEENVPVAANADVDGAMEATSNVPVDDALEGVTGESIEEANGASVAEVPAGTETPASTAASDQ